MRVLDIDLDFFLSAPCPFAEPGCRPDDSCAEPWSEARVRAFMEGQLGLSAASPLPGEIFDTHDGALFFWDRMIREGLLTVPFTITHVDTHSDLGIAQKGYPYVKHLVLCRPPEKRRDFEYFRREGQLNEANYLVFALAARLTDRLENLRNPHSRPDLPGEMLTAEGFLQLRSAFPGLFEAKNGPEPLVVYDGYDDPMTYSAGEKFDFVTVAVSPRYTPKSADPLLSVLKAYIRPI